jgi:cobyrinic acid a,c-diamide synthase
MVGTARAAQPLVVGEVPLPPPGPRVRVGVAAGRAYTFLYADTVGAEVVAFDPLSDTALPDGIHGLLVGRGFPEVHATALADNAPLLSNVRSRVDAGLVMWASAAGCCGSAERSTARRWPA